MINELKLTYSFNGTEKVFVVRGATYGLTLGAIFLNSDYALKTDFNKARFMVESNKALTPAELIEIAEVTEALGKIKAELVAVNVTAEATYLELMKNFLSDTGVKKEV